jgi:hypothetical protein
MARWLELQRRGLMEQQALNVLVRGMAAMHEDFRWPMCSRWGERGRLALAAPLSLEQGRNLATSRRLACGAAMPPGRRGRLGCRPALATSYALPLPAGTPPTRRTAGCCA